MATKSNAPAKTGNPAAIQPLNPDMDPITRYEIILAMAKRGGGFVKGLSKAAIAADALNYERLEAAFPEIWDQYRDLAEWDRKQNTQPK